MKKTITFLSLLFVSVVVYSQSKGITPMHKFLQDFADSTIVIEYPTQSYDSPAYKILSKTRGIVNCFVYQAIDSGLNKLYQRKTVQIPDTLRAFLQLKKNNFRNSLADINIFFNVLKVNADTAKKIWKDISKYKPWQMVDDKAYATCPPGTNYAVVLDDGYKIMHLVTKKEIKTLIYYAPEYYEEQCPGNKNRQAIISINSIFYKKIPFR